MTTSGLKSMALPGTLSYCFYWSRASCYHCGCLSVRIHAWQGLQKPAQLPNKKNAKHVCAQSPWKVYGARAPSFPKQIKLHMSWHGVCCLMTCWFCHAVWKSLVLHVGNQQLLISCWLFDYMIMTISSMIMVLWHCWKQLRFLIFTFSVLVSASLHNSLWNSGCGTAFFSRV